MDTSTVFCGASEQHHTRAVPSVAIKACLDVDSQIPTAEPSLLHDLQVAADWDMPVLFSGASISEAERLALWIHRHGSRRKALFLVLDAAFIDLQAALFESMRSALTFEDHRNDFI